MFSYFMVGKIFTFGQVRNKFVLNVFCSEAQQNSRPTLVHSEVGQPMKFKIGTRSL